MEKVKRKREKLAKRFTHAEMDKLYENIYRQMLEGKSRSAIISTLVKEHGLKIRTSEYHYDKTWETKVMPMYERDYPILISKNHAQYDKVIKQLEDEVDSLYTEYPREKRDFARNQMAEKKAKLMLRSAKQQERLAGFYSENDITIINNDLSLAYHQQEKAQTKINWSLLSVDDLARVLELLEKTKMDKTEYDLYENIRDINFTEVRPEEEDSEQKMLEL